MPPSAMIASNVVPLAAFGTPSVQLPGVNQSLASAVHTVCAEQRLPAASIARAASTIAATRDARAVPCPWVLGLVHISKYPRVVDPPDPMTTCMRKHSACAFGESGKSRPHDTSHSAGGGAAAPMAGGPPTSPSKAIVFTGKCDSG